jgi:hypothetical protein
MDLTKNISISLWAIKWGDGFPFASKYKHLGLNLEHKYQWNWHKMSSVQGRNIVFLFFISSVTACLFALVEEYKGFTCQEIGS